MNHLPFAFSIAVLSLCQGATVAVVRVPEGLRARARRRLLPLAALPVLSLAAFVGGLQLGPDGARILTYLALFAVPLLACLAFAWMVPGARPRSALLVLILFALAWADRQGPLGEPAALLLIGASCVTLGSLLALLAPRRALKAGIFAMAALDTALIVAEQLQGPNRLLERTAPPLGLPQLQSGLFGSAVIGYGDLFVAATLGGLLWLEGGGREAFRGALLTALFALLFDLLFLWVAELPATVPVAAALGTVELARWRNRRLRSR